MRFSILQAVMILVLAGLFAGLFLYAGGTSFFFPSILPAHWSLHLLWERLYSHDMVEAIVCSLFVSSVVSVSSTAVATTTYFIIQVRKTGHTISLWIFYLPFLLSPIIFAIGLQVLFLRFGIAGNILGVIIGQMCIALPYAMILQYRSWQEPIASQLDMARQFHVSRKDMVRHIVWPSIQGILILCLFQTYLISWFDFAFAQWIGMGKVQTLPIALFDAMQEADMAIASASALGILVPVLLLFVLLSIWQRDKKIML